MILFKIEMNIEYQDNPLPPKTKKSFYIQYSPNKDKCLINQEVSLNTNVKQDKNIDRK